MMDRVGGFSTPAIRGVSTQLTQAGNEANVAIYLDGVYQPAQVTGTFDLPDVERVEILKGPQGTLFGRNATGGAIRCSPSIPAIPRPAASARATAILTKSCSRALPARRSSRKEIGRAHV